MYTQSTQYITYTYYLQVIFFHFLFNKGDAFPLVGIATLLATAVEFDQFQRIGKEIMNKINSTESAVTELNKLLDSSKMITETLPPETLSWRISKWLTTGNYVMNDKFNKIIAPTLVIIGKNDRLLPSKNEGRRLLTVMNSTKVELLEFVNTGHAILDGAIDLAKIMSKSKTFQPIVPESPVIDLTVPFPSKEDIENINKQIGPFIKALSPIYLSRIIDPYTKKSRIVSGIKNIPTGIETGRPVLLVGNHQLFGADLGLLVKQFIDEKEVLIRGLAHPLIFSDSNTNRPLQVDIDGNRIVPRRPFQNRLPTNNSNKSTTASALTTSTTTSNNNDNNKETAALVNAASSSFNEMDGLKSLFTKFGAVEVSPG